MAAGIWLLSVYGQHRPGALGLDAPVTDFSAARADAVLGRLLGEDQAPHPVGSPQAAALQARLLKELARLGVPARVETATGCFSEKRWDNIPCGTVRNIIAEVAPGQGKAIVLMAHSDSVPAGPGAGDDVSGVATILETIRALKARAGLETIRGGHPVLAVFTDGEEPGLLGASLWLRDPAARAQVGVVINVEARGNQGTSYLFQTSPGDARLIDVYAKSVSHFATSSFSAEIYKMMPNDTDLTPVLAAGLTGYNFAFVGNVAQYHTPQDRRENLDPRSLQQHGEAMLGLADNLRGADFAALKSGDAIYLDILGRWLPRLAATWALPLSAAAFLVIALAGWLTRRERRALSRPLLALAMPVLLLVGCAGMGFALHGLAAWISGNADPSYAHPLYLRLALGFGLFAVALLAARGAGAIACWLWLAALAIACAIWAPGVTPYFLFPALVAAPLLLVTVRGGRGVALLAGAVAGLLAWLSLTVSGEVIMGLKMHLLFTLSAGFGLLGLLPLLARAHGPAWGWSLAASLLLALGLAVTAGLQPAFSSAAPQRLNIMYVEADGKAQWIASAVAHLPDGLRRAAAFSAVPQKGAEFGYAAPAGPARMPPPAARVTRSGDTVLVDIAVPGEAVFLTVPAEARLRSVTLAGVTTPASGRQVTIMCVTPDCGTAHLELRLGSSAPWKMLLKAMHKGLPPSGARLLAARPADATASQAGDRSIRAAAIAVPGG